MVDLLAPEPNDQCLEPCAGNGLFVKELLARQPSAIVDAIEIDPNAIRVLRERFGLLSNVTVRRADFLALDALCDHSQQYDKIIANPPYGAWQPHERREDLKRAYPDLYVKESATLFLAKAISTLRLGGRAVFILPETFLFSHSHRPLRKRILDACAVESIDVFPSSLFPGISFGYARLSILSLRRVQASREHRCVIRQATSMSELVGRHGKAQEYLQSAIALTPELSFPVNGVYLPEQSGGSHSLTLGDIADCVTGFYSGDDARFLRRASDNAKYANRYPTVDPEAVATASSPPLSGLSGRRCFVPVVKGGGYAYLKPTLWYMDWSESAVQHYQVDRKARFQNSRFYFRKGIGFPMVSSGGARATVIQPHQLFDQSVVGVFPKDASVFGYILALLNSSISWDLLRKINPSTNNSAKYMRRLPVALPSESELKWFSEAVESYVNHLARGGSVDRSLEREIDARVHVVSNGVHQRQDDA